MKAPDSASGTGMERVEYEHLLEFASAVLGRAGLDEFSRDAVSDGLCEASLRGVDTHGIRLLAHYVRSALEGRKNPRPDFRFELAFPAVGYLDADDGFGHAAGRMAVDRGVELADSQGVGVVAVGNSSHVGALASTALRGARRGYITFAFTHADALLLSYNGTRPYFGTNPICFAVPRAGEEPFCLDMSASTISWNQLLMHRQTGEALPEGVAADADGRPTTDPEAAACLLPIGAYKGYGIASMVEVLCGIYTGMAFGRDIPAMFRAPIENPRKLGQFFMVLRTDGVLDMDVFLHRMQEMTRQVHEEPSVEGETVLLAGDKEVREARRRRVEGIPLPPELLRELTSLASTHSVPLVTVEG